MRILVFFDLPVTTGEERRAYTKFRKFLIKDGFLMLQESVYCKLALNGTAANAITERVRKNKPEQGLVQLLTVTEKQYSKMDLIVGEIKSEILHEGKSYDELNYEANSIQFYVRKAAHMTEYFLLAVAVSFPLYVYRVRGFWLFLLAGIFCAGFAGLDEYHQSFVSGRSPSVRDVCIDSSGALIGIILVQLFCWSTLHNPSGSHKNKKKTRKKRRR